MCYCDPATQDGYEYIQWIGDVFDTCVYTPRDQAAFYLGFMNIILWLFAQAPQVWETYQKGRGESLSFGFLFTWLLGDSCNLVGCIITNQSRIQLYTAYYFMGMDAVMMGQFTWYWAKFKWCVPHKQEDEEGYDQEWVESTTAENPKAPTNRVNAVFNACFIGASCLAISRFLPPASAHAYVRSPTNRVLLSDECNVAVSVSDAAYAIGIACAWISGLLYFSARIPQILLNTERKSTEGLSIFLFASSTTANILYGLSILVNSSTDFSSRDFWESGFAYLLGSLGTVATSIPILWQFYAYRQSAYQPLEEALIQPVV